MYLCVIVYGYIVISRLDVIMCITKTGSVRNRSGEVVI